MRKTRKLTALERAAIYLEAINVYEEALKNTYAMPLGFRGLCSVLPPFIVELGAVTYYSWLIDDCNKIIDMLDEIKLIQPTSTESYSSTYWFTYTIIPDTCDWIIGITQRVTFLSLAYEMAMDEVESQI